MKCDEVHPLLDLLYDNALPQKDCVVVLEHLRSCDACQADWNDLEALQAGFKAANEALEVPKNLRQKIHAKLEAEPNLSKTTYWKFAGAGLAAAIVIAVCLPMFSTKNGPRSAAAVISSETLLDKFSQDIGEATGKEELAAKLGYDPVYLKLPLWQMQDAKVVARTADTGIVRFDFAAKGSAGAIQLVCFQGMSGTIKPSAGQLQDLSGKQVLIGSRGTLNYALWTEHGRDYLFVTPLAKESLEAIVRDA